MKQINQNTITGIDHKRATLINSVTIQDFFISRWNNLAVIER